MVREALSLDRLLAMEPREAAALLVARAGEGLSEHERALLDAWIAADESHADALRSVEAGWTWFEGAEKHEILSAMRAHAVAPRARRWATAIPQAAAAAILLIVTVAGLVLLTMPRGGPGAGAAEPTRYVSAAGGVRDIRLSDGSAMMLDARSEALVSLGPQQRTVELIRGRAYFAIAPDRARPFAVTARDRRIVALGTRFDVDLGGGGLVVNLIEGSVAIGPPDAAAAAVRLKAGQQFVERDGQAVIRNVGAAASASPGWTRGLLHFDDTTLAEAAAEVNRYAPVPVVIRSTKVSSLRISGEFRAGDGARFAETVAELHPVRAVHREKEIELVATERPQ